MAEACVEFKGSSFTLSVIYLKTLKLADISADLVKKISQAPDFFSLIPVVVNIEKVDCLIDYQAIKTMIEELNFTFVGFTGSIAKEQRNRIRELGFSFVNTAKVSALKKNGAADERVTIKRKQTTPEPQRQLFSDKIHRGQIRSGQQVYAKDQNLVVIGSVSAGAEVIADGNIHVYGSLRGRAIAGATGHHQAQIYCQNLEAELVSINGNYWLSESMELHWGTPAFIHLIDTELTSSKLS